MKHIITILFIAIFRICFGQEPSIEPTLSQRHIAKINKIEAPAKKLKKYKKLYTRDSIRWVKAQKKYWRQKSPDLHVAQLQREEERPILDSTLVKEVARKGVGELQEVEKSEELEKVVAYKDVKLDSTVLDRAKDEVATELKELDKPKELEVVQDIKPDSAWKDQVMSKAKSEIKKVDKPKELDDFVDIDQIRMDSTLLDSAAMRSMSKKAIAKIEEEARSVSGISELDQQRTSLESNTDELFSPAGVPIDSSGVDQEALKKRAQEKLLSLANQSPGFKALKGKYSKVVNSNDLSSAVKRNSLKGEPLGKRILLGGNFNIVSTNPTVIDVSASIGYKFSKRIISGVLASHRFAKEDSVSVSGGRLFVNYDLVKNFFASSEFEMMRKTTNGEKNGEQWHPGVFLGVGRKFNLFPKVNAQVAVMYNFLYDNTDGIYNRPLVVRFGINMQGGLKK